MSYPSSDDEWGSRPLPTPGRPAGPDSQSSPPATPQAPAAQPSRMAPGPATTPSGPAVKPRPSTPPAPAPARPAVAPATGARPGVSQPKPQPAAQKARPRRDRPPAGQRSGCGAIALVILLLVALGTLLFGLALVGYASIARDLPQPEELQARVSQFRSTLIYDRDGNVLSEVGDPNYGRRTAVPLDQISPYLIDATIATEDPNFYQHPGVDPVGLARALYLS
ncbi:MAG: transglycosylase domain-containing protein, partial [Anaerolineae bacterium]|nr:transglycosylase domain-containing protein [Anaerolineae bacterium]